MREISIPDLAYDWLMEHPHRDMSFWLNLIENEDKIRKLKAQADIWANKSIGPYGDAFSDPPLWVQLTRAHGGILKIILKEEK